MARGVGVSIKQILKKGKTPQTIIAQEGIGQARQFVTEQFGYDFIGLGIKLLVYFAITFIFAKFMEAVVFTSGGFNVLANLLGFKIPQKDQIPDSLKKLFDGGISGFKFWDIVKLIAIILVVAEFIRYVNLPQKSSPMTIGIFIAIVSLLSITTFPELAKRIKMTDFNLASGR